MPPAEIGYIAGIIDGEGSIMLIKFHNNQLPSPCISISSTTIELLNWLKETTGMGIIKRKRNYNSDKHSDSFVYELKYKNAISLLKIIEPYLVIEIKKKRTKFILDYYDKLTPRNGKYTDDMLQAKLQFYDDFITIK